MKLVPISDRALEILAVLLDGGHWSFDEIKTAVGWDRVPVAFYALMRRMGADGLIETFEFWDEFVKADGRLHRGLYPAYQITDKGRTAFAEKVDFVRFIVKSFGGPERTLYATPKAELHRRPVPTRRAESDGLGTEAERAKILNQAPEELRLLARALDAARDVCLIDELIALDIENVRWQGTIRSQVADPLQRSNLQIALPNDLRELIGLAAAQRTTGPVFPNSRGRRWSRQTAGLAWAAARKRAGVSSRVMLLGRLNKQARRRAAGVLL